MRSVFIERAELKNAILKDINGFNMIENISNPTEIVSDSGNMDDCAQITIDYIAGITIFFLAITFVFQFAYSMFTPFQSNSDEVTLAADRASTVLIEQLLSAGYGLNILDQGKLISFNNTMMNSTNYNSALVKLGLISTTNQTTYDMSLTVESIDGNTMNKSGPTVPNTTNVAMTKRLVRIINSSTGYNQIAIISVRVW